MTRGTICVIAQDNNRYTMFSVCFTQLLARSPGVMFDWGISTYVPRARNTLVERALADEAEWVLFIDDDQVFPPTLLEQLLAWEKPIVSALYLSRAGAHTPIAYSHRNEDGLYEPLNLRELPGEGLLKVKACGAGGLLIRTEVFRAISDQPDWFEYGRVTGTDWNASEDIIFCEKADRAGYDIFVDLGCPIGHMAPSAIWPSFIDKEWCLGFSVSDYTKVFVPIEDPAEVDTAPADAVRR